MKIRKRNLFRLLVEISDKLNILIQDTFGFNAKRKVLEKKQDFVTMKELDSTIGKALGITEKKSKVLEKPKAKIKSNEQDYQVSSKALTDFVSFAQKNKLIIDSKKLSDIDFNELHYSDFEISLSIRIENTYAIDGELLIYEKDQITPTSETKLAYQTFKADFLLSVTNQIDEYNIHLFINLFNKPNIAEPFFNFFENDISQLLEWEQTDGQNWEPPYDEKYYFKNGNREILDGDHVIEDGPHIYPFRDFEAFEEFDGIYSDLAPIDFEETLEDIESIKIKGKHLSYKFNLKEEFSLLAIILMASYQKDIARQLNEKFKKIN